MNQNADPAPQQGGFDAPAQPGSPAQPDPPAPTPTLRQSLGEYGRGVAGGLLFSLPMLYTEEVWNWGASLSAERLLVAFLFTFTLLLGYNRYAGLHADASWSEVLIDSVEELGLGILIAAGLLWLLDRVTLAMSFQEAANRVLLEALVVAVGVSVGTAQLGASQDDEAQEGQEEGLQGEGKGLQGEGKGLQGEGKGLQSEGGPQKKGGGRMDHAGSQLVLSICGAFLIVSNVAPTIEIVLIGSQSPPLKLLGLALVSMALAGVILYFSNFIGGHSLGEDGPAWLDVAGGTLLTYAAALVTAGLVLWFFGRFEQAAPGVILAYVVTAGLPAALGASAGRLLLQA